MIRTIPRRKSPAAAAGALVLLLGALAACGGTPPRAAPAAGATAAVTATPSPAAATPTVAATTPAAPAATAPARPAETPTPAIVEENSIFFAAGATRVDPAGEAKLRRHAARLKENPQLAVTLVGHTDNLGSTSYNLAIAEHRAAAVARLLQAMGAGRAQIRHYGMGDEKTGPTCKTAACRQKKRRVDLIYRD